VADAIAEQLAVRQAGERVVQCLMLLGDRLPAAAVDREERQEEQGDGRQREVCGQHDDRREAEQQADGRGLEEEILREVAEHARALDEGDHGRDQPRVDQVVDERGQHHAGQVAGPQMRVMRARQIGRREQDGAGDRRGDRVLREVERDLLARFAAQAVGQQVGGGLPEEAHDGAAHEHHGHGEGGGGGHLPLGAAREDLQRDELADQRADAEHGDLGGLDVAQVVRAGEDQRRAAQAADQDHGEYVDVERVASARHAVRPWEMGGEEGALPREAAGSPAAIPGTLAFTTCDR
jgi:hypothetical protein